MNRFLELLTRLIHSALLTAWLFAISVTGPMISSAAHAQDASPTATATPSNSAGVTNTSFGVSNRDDKLGRSPVVTVTTIPGSTLEEATKILIDAYERNPEYRLYPMSFDIYINRKLFSSQFRSSTLPGPIGVDVGTDVATLPFNYTVIAKVITPNGNPFTTVFEGAVFASQLSASLDCTVTFVGSETTSYVKNNVSINQTGNDSFSVQLEGAEQVGSDSKLDANLQASVSGTSASGSLSTTVDGLESTARVTVVSGSASLSSSSSAFIDMASTDGSVNFSCS